jgi:hypothetical protein
MLRAYSELRAELITDSEVRQVFSKQQYAALLSFAVRLQGSVFKLYTYFSGLAGPAENREQCCFASSIVPQKTKDLPFDGCQRHVLKSISGRRKL